MAGSVRSSRSGRVSPGSSKNNKSGAFGDGEMASPLLGGASKQDRGGATVATSVNSDERERDASSYVDPGKLTAMQMAKWATVLIVAGAGAAASLASFALSPAIIVYVAGGICLMNFPMVIYKENKILFLPSREQEVEQLEDTVELLKQEADLLEDEVEYLLGHASRYAEAEQELQEVALEQGSNVEELVDLIRLNEETMDLMRDHLRQKVIEDVIGIVIRSEKESHQRVDRVEAKLLALKITVKLEAYGITFDEDKFLQSAAMNPTLWGVASAVRKLLPPLDEEHFDDTSVASDVDDVYDMFYMSSGGQQGLGSRSAADRVSLAKRGRQSRLTREFPPGRT